MCYNHFSFIFCDVHVLHHVLVTNSVKTLALWHRPLKYFIQHLVILSCLLFSSLIDRRGFLPPDEAIPAASVSDIELPPFVAKNDAHMVGWTRVWSHPSVWFSPSCCFVFRILLCVFSSLFWPTLHPPDIHNADIQNLELLHRVLEVPFFFLACCLQKQKEETGAY